MRTKRMMTCAACACALAMSVSFAHAAPVTQWSYSTNATFSEPSWFAGDLGGQSVSAHELVWGGGTSYLTPSGPGQGTWWAENQSALTIGNFANSPETLTGGGPATGEVNTILAGDDLSTPGVIGRGVSLTHWNNPIHTQWSSLEGATVIDTITLTPLSEVGDPQDGPVLSFAFKFFETPNAGNGEGLCEDGQTAVYHGWNATNATGGCPDIFAYQTFDIVDLSFIYDGFKYFVSLLTLNADGLVDFVGIPTLLDSQCTAVGLTPGCSGFVTAEGQQTTHRFGFAISAVPLQVPEPGSLALLGLGLAGLAAVSRRRRVSDA